MGVDQHLPAESKSPLCRKQVVRRVAAAVGEFGAHPRQQQGRAREAEKISRRQRHVSLHRQRLSLRRVQGHGGEGAGLRAGLALRGTHPLHHERRRRAGRCVPDGHLAVDPERAARLQAARHRRRHRRQLYRPRHARRGASRRARTAHRPHRDAGARARALLLPRNHRRGGRTISRITSIRARPRKKSPSLRIFRFPKRMSPCAGISASYSISAIRRSNTRTFRSLCRSWSMPAFRSSSCRRPPRCTCRR